MINIKKQIVPSDIASSRTYGNSNPINYITVHQTGNDNEGADAQAHANLQSNGNSRSASWHYSVDDKEIIQSFDDKAQCWAAGDGRGPGNLESIHVELCINSDGNYKKTLENGAKLVSYLMEKYNLSIDRVKQHYDWSRKNCPAQIRANKDGINWDDFLGMVEGEVVIVKPAPTKVKSQTVSKKKNKANLKIDGKWGNDTTRELQKALGTPVDGYLSHQLRNSVTNALYGNTAKFNNTRKGSLVIKTLQRKIGNKPVDGLLGPSCVRDLQRHLGTVVDGKLSRPSLVVKELQRRLNKGTL